MNFLLKNITIGKISIPFPVFLWFTLATIAVCLEMSRGLGAINNFVLYTHIFIHTREMHNLYVGTPLTLFDCHYGPLFSLVIAPYSFFNTFVGCFLWSLTNAAILYYAITQLSLSERNKLIILLISSVEMMTSIHSTEFNGIVSGWIILSFVLVEKKKDFWATFFIVLGSLTKIIGIVGFAFFFFSKNKIKFTYSLLFWIVILFCAPMLISSPTFILHSYLDWYNDLVIKNAKNINPLASNFMQDISVMGMIRHSSLYPTMSNIYVLIPAALFYAFPLMRITQFVERNFRLNYLAFALIGVVIFNTSSESPTYVIAMVGVAIWYITQTQQEKKFANFFLIFALLITSLSPTDLFPAYIRDNFIRPYSLKALPCFLIWLIIAWQLLTKKWVNNNVMINDNES
ncbi:MAG: glycosyltransferase family 87 protein [Flavobacterium sp.]|nr:glycosyltransferase family 87 protein [Flavobacterium sp.]